MIQDSMYLGLPFNETIAFSDCRGVFQEQIKENQIRMAKDYASLLQLLLEDREEILLVMRACSPVAFVVELMPRWMAYYLRRCTLVITDRRLLHFPARMNYKPRFSVSQIRFSDIQKIGFSRVWRKQFIIKYRSGKQEMFLYVRNREKLQDILPVLELGKGNPAVGSRQHLCPLCAAPLFPDEYLCRSCKLSFKNDNKGTLLALAVPGGGYFYTNHPFVGVQHFVLETTLLIMALSSACKVAGFQMNAYFLPAIIYGSLFSAGKILAIVHVKQFVREYIPDLG